MLQEIILFLRESYFIVIYGLTLIISIFTYRKYFDTVLKYFPVIIAYTLFNELLGYFIRYYPNFSLFQELLRNTENDIIYNIYVLIYSGFFYYVYWKLNSNVKFKKWILKSALASLIVYIASLFFQNPLKMALFYAISFSSCVLVFCIVLYFYDKNLKKEKLVEFTNLMFWVNMGLLVFHSIFPILYIFAFKQTDLWIEYNLVTILRVLVVVMYTIFIIGFIKGRRRSFG